MFIRVQSCEKLDQKTIMPCLPLCRLNLAIVQNRNIRTWIMSTINLLENSAGLYQFTLELPWPGFTPENIIYLIRQFSEYHTSVNNRIQSLTRISASGCHLCRSRQQQARSPQYWVGIRSSPWKWKQDIFKNCTRKNCAYMYFISCRLLFFQYDYFVLMYLSKTDPTRTNLNVCKLKNIKFKT